MSRSLLLSVLLSVNCSSVGSPTLSVVSGCVSRKQPITIGASRSNTLTVDGVELMLIIVATFGQALSGQGHAVNIIGVLVVWRFIMGVGIGGDYPLSAVISSEFASTHLRGRLMTAVFANQGWGQFSECPPNGIRFSNSQILHRRCSRGIHRGLRLQNVAHARRPRGPCAC